MTFSTSINYVQNVPVSFGFSNYLNPSPSRQVSVTFDQVAYTGAGVNYGQVQVPDVAGVTVQTGRNTVNSSGSGSIVLSGEVSAVNTALNGCTWVGNFYEIEDTDQDFLALNRSLGNYKGELEIQIPSGSNISGLAAGSFVKFNTIPGANIGPYIFTITKIISTSTGIRIWLVYTRAYSISDTYYASNYKNININADISHPCYLQTTAGVIIGPVNDMSFGNAQGTITISFVVVDGTTETNTFTLIGSPQIAEPTFLTLPPTSVSAVTVENWNTVPQMGTIAQADENYQSIQFLFKCSVNDPKYLEVENYTDLPGYPSGGTDDEKLLFIGNAINAKASLDIPVYIEDNSYGMIGDAQVNNRASVTYTDTQPVRWSFYGTPTECNNALGRIFYWRPAAFNQDFVIETRIVNGRTRIYSSRGK